MSAFAFSREPVSLTRRSSSASARVCSWSLRLMRSMRVFSSVQLVKTLFFKSCWVIVEAPSEK